MKVQREVYEDVGRNGPNHFIFVGSS